MVTSDNDSGARVEASVQQAPTDGVQALIGAYGARSGRPALWPCSRSTAPGCRASQDRQRGAKHARPGIVEGDQGGRSGKAPRPPSWGRSVGATNSKRSIQDCPRSSSGVASPGSGAGTPTGWRSSRGRRTRSAPRSAGVAAPTGGPAAGQAGTRSATRGARAGQEAPRDLSRPCRVPRQLLPPPGRNTIGGPGMNP